MDKIIRNQNDKRTVSNQNSQKSNLISSVVLIIFDSIKIVQENIASVLLLNNHQYSNLSQEMHQQTNAADNVNEEDNEEYFDAEDLSKNDPLSEGNHSGKIFLKANDNQIDPADCNTGKLTVKELQTENKRQQRTLIQKILEFVKYTLMGKPNRPQCIQQLDDPNKIKNTLTQKQKQEIEAYRKELTRYRNFLMHKGRSMATEVKNISSEIETINSLLGKD